MTLKMEIPKLTISQRHGVLRVCGNLGAVNNRAGILPFKDYDKREAWLFI